MRKIKYKAYITEDEIDNIIMRKFPEKICPHCKHEGLYAGAIETQYESKYDEYIVLSFSVFCDKCHDFIDKWDNTDRKYFLAN